MRVHTDPALALQRVFCDALKVVGIRASGLLLGCASPALHHTSGTLASDAEFIPVTCTEGSSGLYDPSFLDIRPALPVDFLEVLVMGRPDGEQRGKPCSEAHDVPACLARLDASYGAKDDILAQRGEDWYYANLITCGLRATRGDEVLSIETLPDLKEFLGVVDTLAEAELQITCRPSQSVEHSLPGQARYVMECGRSGGVPHGSGFDVLAFSQQGCFGYTRHLLHVDAGGRISVLDNFVEQTREPMGTCLP